MTADDILFEPITTSSTSPSQGLPAGVGGGIIRYPGVVSGQIDTRLPKTLYTDLATEFIDFAVTDLPLLVDIRSPNIIHWRGQKNLVDIVERFYDGFDDMWISRPNHMTATLHKFTGRFGLTKACKMPQDNGPLTVMTWYWIGTDNGQLPALDLGLLVVHPVDKWYRCFTNQADAMNYYQTP